MPVSIADAKLSELILFISERSEGDERFGAVKLNKILFYADFAAYLIIGKSITGQEYQRLDNGPAPRRLLLVRNKLVAAGHLAIRKIEYFNQTQDRPFALREADLSAFTAEQIGLVTQIIDENWKQNATQISLRSHEFHGWEDAESGETIPYEIALLSKREPSTNERKRLSHDAKIAAEALSRRVKVVPLDA